jgi:hypothetical protein
MRWKDRWRSRIRGRRLRLLSSCLVDSGRLGTYVAGEREAGDYCLSGACESEGC